MEKLLYKHLTFPKPCFLCWTFWTQFSKALKSIPELSPSARVHHIVPNTHYMSDVRLGCHAAILTCFLMVPDKFLFSCSMVADFKRFVFFFFRSCLLCLHRGFDIAEPNPLYQMFQLNVLGLSFLLACCLASS